jgi:cell division GTPase FtsZ
MIVDMARYTGVIDLCASGDAEVLYPFQRHLRIDLRTRSETQIESSSDFNNVIFSLAHEATEGLLILFVLSHAGSRNISAGLEVIGQISRSKNILTIGIFSGEVLSRNENAIGLYNSTFLLNSSEGSSWRSDATSIIRGISDTIVAPGLVGIDIADVKEVLHDAGETLMATATGRGPDRTIIAAKAALRHLSTQSPNFSSASSILVSAFDGIHANIVELDRALQIIAAAFNNEPVIMASLIPDDQMQDNFTIKVFAAGFPHHKFRQFSGTRP